jgi:hypothetical protein
MKKRSTLAVMAVLIFTPLVVLWGFQMRHSQQWEREMQDPVDDPPDAARKGEFTFARLRYRSAFRGGGFGYGRRGGGGSRWGTDANRADRLFEIAVKRLTRVDSQSVEEIIDIDSGPLNDYPWLYAVEVGDWGFTTEQGKRLREYLDRGGFLMVDDFHGTREWAVFMEGLKQIFPDRTVVDIPDSDAIFHVIADLDHRIQVPGMQFLRSGRTYEQDGYRERWAAIYDDKGRIQVAICHNMDLGDAWQYADYAPYPQDYAGLALRIGVNYVAYAMTH